MGKARSLDDKVYASNLRLISRFRTRCQYKTRWSSGYAADDTERIQPHQMWRRNGELARERGDGFGYSLVAGHADLVDENNICAFQHSTLPTLFQHRHTSWKN